MTKFVHKSEYGVPQLKKIQAIPPCSILGLGTNVIYCSEGLSRNCSSWGRKAKSDSCQAEQGTYRAIKNDTREGMRARKW